MDNPVIIAVLLVAAAQALTILLTVRRERDIKELRELFHAQRLHIVELRAWIVGRNTALPGRIKSDREPISEPIANNIKAPEPAIAPKDVPETIQLRTTGDEAAQSGQADSGGSHPAGQEQWPIEDLQRFVARLKEGVPPEPAIPPKDLPDTTRPSANGDELERATKAINWLKEDVDKAREVGTSLYSTPAEKKTG
jgi:hypothetical protein